MDVREFPVLTDEDEALVEQYAAGLGEPTARVLSYLSRRRADPALDSSATLTDVHVGTGLGSAAVRDELVVLEAAELVERTTVETRTPGRPPAAWDTLHTRDESMRRVYERHAKKLLEQAEDFARTTAERATADSDTERTTADSDAERATDDSGAKRVDEPLTIGLNWRPNGLHAPVFAARDADAGNLDAIEAYEGSRAAVRAVIDGTVDVGVAGAATVLRERARGRPVVPVALLYQRTPVVLYTTRDVFGEPFEALSQLRGRRLGAPAGTEPALLAALLLEQAGVRDAVEVVPIEGEERIPLRAGEIDVATGAHSDPRRLERVGEAVDVVAVAAQYPAAGPALVAHRDALTERRPRIESILAATTAGWASPTRGSGLGALERRSAESADRIERTATLAMDRFGTGEAVRTNGWGWHEPAAWRGLRDALAQGAVL